MPDLPVFSPLPTAARPSAGSRLLDVGRLLAAPRTAAQGVVVATCTADLRVPTNDNLDVMAAGPDGNRYVGGRGGKLNRVSPAGLTRASNALRIYPLN